MIIDEAASIIWSAKGPGGGGGVFGFCLNFNEESTWNSFYGFEITSLYTLCCALLDPLHTFIKFGHLSKMFLYSDTLEINL